jgi:hypothetical protein
MIQNMKGGIMKTETLFEEAVTSLRAYYQGSGNYHRGAAVDLTQRIVDLTGRDHNDIWEEIEAAAR